MIRINNKDYDLDRFEKIEMSSLTNYQRNNPNYQPTHFSLTKQDNGYDKVTYYRKKQLK